MLDRECLRDLVEKFEAGNQFEKAILENVNKNCYDEIMEICKNVEAYDKEYKMLVATCLGHSERLLAITV